MGTVVSFDVRDLPDTEAAAVVGDSCAWLHWVDETFSVHRPDSEVSRLGRGELSLDEADPEVRWVLAACDDLVVLTEGSFQHRPEGRPDRPLDPSGLVKGWSIDRVGLLLRMAGSRCFAVNAGGDVLTAGRPDGHPWRVGVRNPEDSMGAAAVLAVEDGAVATSGTYERGAHLWGERHPDALLSVSVVGPDLATADALATALWAAGEGWPRWLAAFAGYEVLVIGADREVRWAAGLDDRLMAPSPY